MINKLPLVDIDPLLKPFEKHLLKRHQQAYLRELEFTEGKTSIANIANGHLYYGLHKNEKGWVFREKAPNATQIYIYGDFSYWQINPQFALQKISNSDWEIHIPSNFLKHGTLYKLWVVWSDGADERIPTYATRVIQDPSTHIFSAQVWDPPFTYRWKHPTPPKPLHPIIYEAHVGMASQQEKIATFQEFSENVIPRIKSLGYNTLQLMALQEHPYYGSFGYQVSSFFAPSSRFGTPEDLMHLIDVAHAAGLSVIMDIVHSHAVSNPREGIAYIDGNSRLYFTDKEASIHPIWHTHCFDYGKRDTLFFLLSNLKYWLETFHLDGFRFDGVTSMCYKHHGIGKNFGNYQLYFDKQVDEDAIIYLTLAQKLIKQVQPQAFTIAEDVSAIPGIAFPTNKGGIGFDFRMAMGITDYWTKLLKETPDEYWSPGDIFFHLTDKRPEEQIIAYAESHDQAIVGDQTFLSRMIGSEIYTAMQKNNTTFKVNRAIALHKIIRLLTATLAQGGYLNFMGNEFGHPEWIDFPRKENNFSYHFARRQWNLAEDENLVYHFLYIFEKEMIKILKSNELWTSPPQIVEQNNSTQVLAYLRESWLFVVNLSPLNSHENYTLQVPSGNYHLVLDSDSSQFGGFGRIKSSYKYTSFQEKISLYLPTRTALVFLQQE